MKSLFVFFAVLALTLARECSDAEIAGVASCYRTYLSGFNITMVGLELPEYWFFHDIRMDWLNKEGTKAQPTICQLGLGLASCLKTFPCLEKGDYDRMGQHNMTEENDWWIDLAVTQYQCGDGYDILMSDFYCMGTCRAANEDKLDACQTQFNHDIPRKGLCKAQQTFLNCQTDILSKCCDWNAGVFMCMSTLTGFNAVEPLCYNEHKVSCPNKRVLEFMRTLKMRRMHSSF